MSPIALQVQPSAAPGRPSSMAPPQQPTKVRVPGECATSQEMSSGQAVLPTMLAAELAGYPSRLTAVEGAVREGGRGPSIWDAFAHTPGKTFGNQTGDVACDFYARCACCCLTSLVAVSLNRRVPITQRLVRLSSPFMRRYPEDVALMRALGIRHFRFSLAWPRLLPSGRGEVNPAGAAFYNRLIDALLEAGIEPHVTLVSEAALRGSGVSMEAGKRELQWWSRSVHMLLASHAGWPRTAYQDAGFFYTNLLQYHWDLPLWLHKEYGGWLHPQVVSDFAAYAEVRVMPTHDCSW